MRLFGSKEKHMRPRARAFLYFFLAAIILIGLYFILWGETPPGKAPAYKGGLLLWAVTIVFVAVIRYTSPPDITNNSFYDLVWQENPHKQTSPDNQEKNDRIFESKHLADISMGLELFGPFKYYFTHKYSFLATLTIIIALLYAINPFVLLITSFIVGLIQFTRFLAINRHDNEHYERIDHFIEQEFDDYDKLYYTKAANGRQEFVPRAIVALRDNRMEVFSVNIEWSTHLWLFKNRIATISAESIFEGHIRGIKQNKQAFATQKLGINAAKSVALLEEHAIKGVKQYLKDHGLSYYPERQLWEEPDTIKEMKEVDYGVTQRFQNMSPYEFEAFVGNLFEAKGFNVEQTTRSGDFGLDLIAENGLTRYGVQVKRYKQGNKVGAPDVQKTLGSLHKVDANKAILVTTSRFTGPAHEQARDAPIELWDWQKLQEEIDQHIMDI